MPQRPIRLGVIGGRRAAAFDLALQHLGDRLALTAVCDLNAAMLDQWADRHPDLAGYHDFERMLADDVCDAVLITTPMQVHADQAVAALRAGKHVISEVTACITHDEALRLVDAVEDTGLTYMMAENYTYMRPHMMVRHMVEQGVFGELTYAEGMYVHDCRHLKFREDGTLTWRGELARDMDPCNYYPTHSLGPIAQWLGLGRDDQIATVYCAANRATCMADYAQRRFGEQHPGAAPDHWRRGDGAQCLVTTERGRLISLRVDSSSHRPHHMTIHELQGTRGCYRTQGNSRDEPLVWLDGRSPGKPGHGFEHASEWDKLYQYADEFEHPRWKQHGETARKAGHGGGDFFVLEDFINAIEGEAPNPIDVYDAVTWSSIIWLSAESARTGCAVRGINYRDKTARQEGVAVTAPHAT
ncbi:MAG: Gfo/Idh/MocA family protein [Phycisphaeraceae bacterium]